MNRRLFRKCAAWLLPLLALHAFLPAGFMLAVDAQGLELAFCPGQLPGFVQSLDSGPAAQHAHHLTHATHHDSSSSQLAPSCPYALAALAFTVDVPPAELGALPFTDEFIQQRSIFQPGAGPFRADRIRGPPSFS
jgi:hypothetical protein